MSQACIRQNTLLSAVSLSKHGGLPGAVRHSGLVLTAAIIFEQDQSKQGG